MKSFWNKIYSTVFRVFQSFEVWCFLKLFFEIWQKLFKISIFSSLKLTENKICKLFFLRWTKFLIITITWTKHFIFTYYYCFYLNIFRYFLIFQVTEKCRFSSIRWKKLPKKTPEFFHNLFSLKFSANVNLQLSFQNKDRFPVRLKMLLWYGYRP